MVLDGRCSLMWIFKFVQTKYIESLKLKDYFHSGFVNVKKIFLDGALWREVGT